MQCMDMGKDKLGMETNEGGEFLAVRWKRKSTGCVLYVSLLGL